MTNKPVKVGDIVTWRSPPKTDSAFEPMGVRGCEVLEIGVDEKTGEPAALIRALGIEMGARLADLHKDEDV